MKHLAFLPALLLTTFLHAQPGTIDPDFNPSDSGFGYGDAVTGFVHCMARQANGQVVIAGQFSAYNGIPRANIARINADGTLDTGFDPGTGTNNTVEALALQPDGKILIAGNFTSYNGTARNRIARLNANGSLDVSFDPGSGANNTVQSLAIQSDGKILVGGSFTTYNGTGRVRIARLNANGGLDAGFTTGSGASAAVRSISVLADGKILVAGEFTLFNGSTFTRVVRLNTNGGLDYSFDPGTGANAAVASMTVQSDGRIVIGGDFTTFNGVDRNRIARLNADGSLDHSFDPGTGAGATVASTAVQTDGKIVIGGDFTTFNGTSRVRIARLNPNGTLDTGFEPGTGASSTVMSMATLPGGQVLIGGRFNVFQGLTCNRLARLHTDGALDLSFNPGSGSNNSVEAIAVRPDGKILITGNFTRYNSTVRARIAQLNPDGSLDMDFDPGTGADNTVSLTTVLPEGKVLIAGNFTSYNGTSRNRIARLNPDGSLDGGFDPGTGANNTITCMAVEPAGTILIGGAFTSYNNSATPRIARINADGGPNGTFYAPNGPNGNVWAIGVHPDGRILIGGDFTFYEGVAAPRLTRLNANGSPDISFDPGMGANGNVGSIVVLPDGKILIAGSFTSYNGTSRNRIARLNPDGSLDESFDPGTGANNVVRETAVLPNGKIVIVGGFSAYNGTTRNGIARLNPDGSLDMELDPGSGANNSVEAIAIQPDRNILIGGWFTAYNGAGRNRVARVFGSKDCPLMLANVGDPCDDNDADTGNDTVDGACNCVGLPIDCEGVAGGSALPGTPCDDGDPTTGNDTWDGDCTCVGLPIDCEGVAGGSALPGTPCDDGDPTTGNDTWDGDCTCVGLPIDCEGVAGGSALPGTPCDDGDPTTGNDTWDGDCTCVGLPLDCEGVAGGSALPGTPCDDGNAITINDVYSNDCVCAGIDPCANESTPPDAICQNITVLLDESGQATITPQMVDGGSTDACGIVNMSLSRSVFDCGDVRAAGLHFDGIDDRVLLPDIAALNNATQFTIEARLTFHTIGQFMPIFVKRSVPNHYIQLQTDHEGHLALNVGLGGDGFERGNTPLIAGQEYFFTLVFNGDLPQSQRVKLYINGVSETISDASLNPAVTADAPGTPIYLGYEPPGLHSSMTMTELRVWDHARSPEQVAVLANTKLTVPLPGVVALYRFDQGQPDLPNPAETQLIDMTGVHHGTLDNFTLDGTASNWVGNGPVPVTLSVYDANNNVGTCAAEITVVPITGIQTSTVSLCSGSDLHLISPSANGTSYSWAGPNGFHSSEQSPVIPNVTTSNAGTYYCTAETACYEYSRVEVVVNPPPMITSVTSTPIALCSPGDVQLEATADVRPAPYCVPVFESDCQGTERLRAVQFADLFRVSECDGNVATAVGFFSSPQAHVVAGHSYTLSILFTNTTTKLKVWIDFDRNGEFNETNELVFASQNATSHYTNITIPTYAVNGPTRIRFMANHDAWPIDACTPGSAWGEVEDYLVNITGGVDMEVSFSWSPAELMNDASIADPVATVPGTTVYTVTATTTGCPADTAFVEVPVGIAPTAAIVPDRENICPGDQVTLIAQADGLQPYTYDWQPGGMTTAQVTVQPEETTTYTLTVTDACGSSSSVAHSVTVKPAPTAIPSSNELVCMNGELQLHGQSDIGSSFVWNGPNGFHSIEQHPVIQPPTLAASGTYTFTATYDGCSTTSTLNVMVDRAPEITSITADPGTICAGHDTQLEVAALLPAPENYCVPAFPYPEDACIWGTFIQSVDFAGIERQSECDGNVVDAVSFFPSPQAHVVAGNSYPMTVTTVFEVEMALKVWIDLDQDGTFDEGTEVVYSAVNDWDIHVHSGMITIPPTAKNGPTRIRFFTQYWMAPVDACTVDPDLIYGEVEDYIVNITGGVDPELSYSWEPAASLSAPNVPDPVASPTENTTYTVTVTSADGCSTTADITVTIDTDPVNCPVLDCAGVPGGSALPGTACDDGDPSTINDVYGADCLCAGVAAHVQVSVKVYLDGCYDPATGLMRDDLRALGLVPTTEPYTGMGHGFVDGGGETTTPMVLATTGDDAIVDWVVIELRDKTDADLVLHSRAALLQRDGDVVDVDGTSPVQFSAEAASYHLAVLHRNHLGCMTGVAVALTTQPTTIDLTQAATTVFGMQARKTVDGAHPASVLWAGDVNGDGRILYTGADNDRDPILEAVGGVVPTSTIEGYHNEDVNLDGTVKYTGDNNDRDIILQNVGGVVPTNVQVGQLP